MSNTRDDKSEIPQKKTRIAFRGDTRPPETIFSQGFVSRKPESDIIFHEEQDLESSSAVAVSWRLRPTSYFPIDNPSTTQLWIYVDDIDLSEANNDKIFYSAIDAIKRGQEQKNFLIDSFGPPLLQYARDSKVVDQSSSTFFYTHGRQVLESMVNPDGSSVKELFFADEFAVKEIKPENILFAVLCNRIFTNPQKVDLGGTYKLGRNIQTDPNGQDIISNPDMNKDIPQERLEQIKKFLQFEIDLSRNQEMKMVSMSRGYQQSSVSREYQESFQRQKSMDDSVLKEQTFLNLRIEEQIAKIKENGEYDNEKWKDPTSCYPQKFAVLTALKNYLNYQIQLDELNYIISLNPKYKEGGGFFKSETEALVILVKTFKESIQPTLSGTDTLSLFAGKKNI